ncbi:MAG: SEC-C domain-containing protein [Spirochaetes bacterium]|nr:SEC-C domain-containing protein [Spirochaetota bacterium]
MNKKFHITPNDPCYCGSGKKYKYCCRDNPQSNAEFLKRYYTHWQLNRHLHRQIDKVFLGLGKDFFSEVQDSWFDNPFL